MEIIKIVGIGLIALVIILILRQYKPEYAIYVSLIAGILILTLSLGQLSGIINLLKDISSRASINTKFLSLLLKITGISFLTEFAVSISKDSGESAIANKIDLGGKVLIIVISIPIITALLEIVIKIIPYSCVIFRKTT